MISENYIKEKISKLFEKDPNIHISVNMPRYPLKLNDAEARIVGVYAHIVGIEIGQNGAEKRYFFQYGEIITKNVVIAELKLL